MRRRSSPLTVPASTELAIRDRPARPTRADRFVAPGTKRSSSRDRRRSFLPWAAQVRCHPPGRIELLGPCHLAMEHLRPERWWRVVQTSRYARAAAHPPAVNATTATPPDRVRPGSSAAATSVRGLGLGRMLAPGTTEPPPHQSHCRQQSQLPWARSPRRKGRAPPRSEPRQRQCARQPSEGGRARRATTAVFDRSLNLVGPAPTETKASPTPTDGWTSRRNPTV